MDDREFDDFFRRELPRLVRLLLKLGAGRFEAEDIAQAALSEVWQRWDRVRNPSAYAYQVTLHTFRGTRRSAPREVALDADLQADPSSLDKLNIAELDRQVLRLLRRLPRQQRTVMALTCDGFRPAEISEITDIPSVTVRAHLREARRKMRQWLTDEGLL